MRSAIKRKSDKEVKQVDTKCCRCSCLYKGNTMETAGLVLIIGLSCSALILALRSLTKEITKELSGIRQGLDKILRHLDEKRDGKTE